MKSAIDIEKINKVETKKGMNMLTISRQVISDINCSPKKYGDQINKKAYRSYSLKGPI